MRVGRASDVNPISVPCVVARKTIGHVDPNPFVERISRPQITEAEAIDEPSSDDEYAVPLPSNDPVSSTSAHLGHPTLF
jgi:actin-related protein 8